MTRYILQSNCFLFLVHWPLSVFKLEVGLSSKCVGLAVAFLLSDNEANRRRVAVESRVGAHSAAQDVSNENCHNKNVLA
jgi:hypothetical protein